MEFRLNVPLNAEAVALEIASHDDETICAFIKTILDTAARLELDERLVAQTWRGIEAEYQDEPSGAPSLLHLLMKCP